MIYADTSALGRAYFADEAENETLRALLLEVDNEPVVTSALARLEIASAAHRAARAGRISNGDVIVRRFDADCAIQGPIVRISLRPKAVLPSAVELVAEHGLRAMDAIHLAVALTDALPLAGGESLTFVTRDAEQAAAARARGLSVA